ncbi:MAG TPA: hypothetical protein ENN69_01520, partial [Spirochaetia bacterium]|nr:hypothetical protein [Spirochaetia bacterium]
MRRIGRTAILLLTFALTAGPQLTAEIRYYRSDQVGLELEPIARIRRDEFEYVLEVEKEERRAVKRLYRDDKEWKRWETLFDGQGLKTDIYEYRDGKLLLHTMYDAKGRVKTEEAYADGKLTERRLFAYSPRGLDYVDTLDSNGERLYTDEYFLAPTGRLRTIRRIYPDESMAVIHFTYGGGLLVYQWEYRDGRITDIRYNEDGTVAKRE